jgi:Arc/MetJ-type ribon-helix-helix transcriptional regulator
MSAMTTQIAVRLPDEMVKFVDRLVAAGEAPSRASVLERALAREIRRRIAAQDASIMAHTRPDAGLAVLAEYTARRGIGLD